ncbi:MAG TPA: carboxypeptidase M32 [Dongiaceae bacterium]
MTAMDAYRSLETRFRRWSALREAAGVLHWDMSAMMPEGGHGARAEQLAAIDVVSHEMLTAPVIGELIAKAGDVNTMDSWQRANLAEMQRTYVHATALDSDLVEALTKASATCESIWRQARPAGDFAAVQPHLEKLLALTRQAAEAKAAKLDCSPYEALMDQYEPGARVAAIDPIFADYADFLPDFLADVLDAQERQPLPVEPRGPFPIDQQKALGQRIMATLGFDFDHGRLDTSLHPFCGGTPDDVRITTRYDENQFVFALMGIIHETGHALYERQLPPTWRLQPVGQARGMTVHESQSLLMEMQACRSPEFFAYLSPLLAETFPGHAAAFAPDNLQRLYTRVKPGFIRVDADEVTYPAHVILRYRLEQALISGDLAVADLPGAWNDGVKQLLGLVVTSDREGCLQDIHWFDGAFGYFPCYSLGAMTAAQIFAAAVAAEPGIPAAIGRGDFAPLRNWLAKNVHGLGSSLSTPEIVTRATGKPLDSNIFKAHLRRRYLGT